MYAISTYGEGYSIHCRGKPEIRQNMEIGIFILRVAADCRVQGRDWTLPGVAHLQAQLAITPYSSVIEYIHPCTARALTNTPRAPGLASITTN